LTGADIMAFGTTERASRGHFLLDILFCVSAGAFHSFQKKRIDFVEYLLDNRRLIGEKV